MIVPFHAKNNFFAPSIYLHNKTTQKGFVLPSCKHPEFNGHSVETKVAKIGENGIIIFSLMWEIGLQAHFLQVDIIK